MKRLGRSETLHILRLLRELIECSSAPSYFEVLNEESEECTFELREIIS